MAGQVLSGTSPRDIPPQVGEKGAYLFSRRQLNEFGITLPE